MAFACTIKHSLSIVERFRKRAFELPILTEQRRRTSASDF